MLEINNSETKQQEEQKLSLVIHKTPMLKPELILALDIQYFGGEGEGEGESEDNDGTNPDGKVDDTAGTQPDDTSEEDDKVDDKANTKTFTQEQLNAIAAEESRKAKTKLLTKLGVKNVDEAVERMQQFNQYLESQKSEEQKQSERVQELEQNYNNCLTENEQLKAEIAAIKVGINSDSVEDAILLARKYLNDDTDMSAAMKIVADKYPSFKEITDQKALDEEQVSKKKKPKFSEDGEPDAGKTDSQNWANAFNFLGSSGQ